MTLNTVAHEMLSVVPSIMRALQKKWKSGPIHGVTHSQFLMMMYLHHHPGSALQDVAHNMSLTPATTSTAIEELVSADLVLREVCKMDRRKVNLHLTAEGLSVLEKIFELSRHEVSGFLSSLTEEQLSIISQALQLLMPLFITEELD